MKPGKGKKKKNHEGIWRGEGTDPPIPKFGASEVSGQLHVRAALLPAKELLISYTYEIAWTPNAGSTVYRRDESYTWTGWLSRHSD